MEKAIPRGFSENSIIRKYKNAAIPKIIKRKSALTTHKRINIKKIKSIESKNYI